MDGKRSFLSLYICLFLPIFYCFFPSIFIHPIPTILLNFKYCPPNPSLPFPLLTSFPFLFYFRPIFIFIFYDDVFLYLYFYSYLIFIYLYVSYIYAINLSPCHCLYYAEYKNKCFYCFIFTNLFYNTIFQCRTYTVHFL
jgi:hypothetical protein